MAGNSYESIKEKQVGEKIECFGTYNSVTVTYIGHLSQLSGLALANKVGAKFSGDGGQVLSTAVKSSVLEKIQADQSKWTCNYLSGDFGQGDGSDGILRRVWSMSMSQIEKPLEVFLDPDGAYKFNAWKETDLSAKKNFQYVVPSNTGGTYENLTDKALSCAKKNFAGVESVLRFYPQATRTTTYSSKHVGDADKLNHIDNTPNDEFSAFGVEWLKSGHDLAQSPDGTWTLTETWIGAPKWDKDLYGTSAWTEYQPS